MKTAVLRCSGHVKLSLLSTNLYQEKFSSDCQTEKMKKKTVMPFAVVLEKMNKS